MLARMQVALRHKGRVTSPAVTRYEHDGLEIDVEAHRVRGNMFTSPPPSSSCSRD
ncbi:MAG: hypothetical protein R3E42_11870 [Burkholderiaceae bacterium]